MQNKIEQYIAEKKLFEPNDSLLLAVSGGADSVAMAYVLRKLGYTFEIAHCNFLLRGEDSELDEAFVVQLAKDLDVVCHVNKCSARLYSEEKAVSIEMAARDLRYNWFALLLEEKKHDYLLTAHHANDLVETFHLNSMRGGGIRALTSLEAVRDSIRRPMLCVTRSQIEIFMTENNLTFRTDLTNFSDEYLRNKIRHQIIPAFEQIKSDYVEKMTENIFLLQETKQIFLQKIADEFSKVRKVQDDMLYLDIEKTLKLKPLQTYLFEFIRPYGFNLAQILDIISAMKRTNIGAQFFSKQYKLNVDRKFLIISETTNETVDTFEIVTENQTLEFPLNLTFEILKKNNLTDIQPNKNIAYLDLEKLADKLVFRHWQNGDFFYPLGLNQKKKLKKFFVDNKMSRFQKENQWIMCSENQIVWVVGQRIDNRFKVTDNTQRILVAKMNKD